MKKSDRHLSKTMRHQCRADTKTLISETSRPQAPLDVDIIDKQIFPHRSDVLKNIHRNQATGRNKVIHRHDRVPAARQSLQAETLHAKKRRRIVMPGVEIARTDAGQPLSLHPQAFGSEEQLSDHRIMGYAVLIGKDDILRTFFLPPGNSDVLRRRDALIVLERHYNDFPAQMLRKPLGKPLFDAGGGSIIDDNGERHLRDKRTKQPTERGQLRLIGDHNRNDNRILKG